ncbi:MAG: hypothetical protein CM15mP77_4220 [Synechococcus sp.]|nr:MAG: hypothetical protein CM15mP77_4220 [Synechococcus sp.]
MALAVLGLLINYAGDGGIAATAWIWIIAGTFAGGISVPSRARVPMTSMPETVALFNGCGGCPLAGGPACAVPLKPVVPIWWQSCRSSFCFRRCDHLHGFDRGHGQASGLALHPAWMQSRLACVNIALAVLSLWQQSS